MNEYQSLVSAAGVSELPGRSRIAVRGSDRLRFLHSFCTNDIQGLTPGLGCEAFVTSHQGKTVGHVCVLCTDEALLLDTVPDQAAGLIAHFDRFVISDDVALEDLSAANGHLLVSGPKSRALLQTVCGAELPRKTWEHRQMTMGGKSVQVILADFLLPESFFLVAPVAEGQAVQQLMIDAGIVPCGIEAVEAARLESGTPLFGRDITPDNLPQEIGRDSKAISFTKGCYLGQETVARIDAMGHVNRLLVGIRFVGPDAAVPQPGTELRSGDKSVGHTTSAAWSPQLAQPLALAVLRRAQAADGTKLDSAIGPAEVVRLPLPKS